MVQFPKFISRWFGLERPLSVSVKSIEAIFDEKSEQQVFLDLVIARFEHYDELNRSPKNEHFSADIEFIIHCITNSLTTSDHINLFPGRINGYFYMYRRILEYLHLANEHKKRIDDLRRQFYQQLTSTFKSTQGIEPNLCVADKNLLQRLNIQEHLWSIGEVNNHETLILFFVLCKLSLQTSLIIGGDNQLKWIHIVSRIHLCQMSLVNVISEYLKYKEAFKPFPLDIPAFMYLIRMSYLPKHNQISSLEFLIGIINPLGFKPGEFFEQFYFVFAENLRNQLYDTSHICSLLHLLSVQDERLFFKYLSSYPLNVNVDILWDILLVFIKNGDINEVIQKNISSILISRMQTIEVEIFLRYYKLVNEYLKPNKADNHPIFSKLFEQIFQAYLNKQLTDDTCSHRLNETHLKSLLNIVEELSLTKNLQQSPYCLIIRHLLFKLDRNIPKKNSKIRSLFLRLDKLNSEELFKSNDPFEFIKDEWFNDLIFELPRQWLDMYKHDYQVLCDAHHENNWSLYIWSKIIHLSFIKSDSSKPNDILQPLNQWMVDVKHDTYDAKDTLTNIFVKKAFELVIAKQMKSITSLSNIDVIIQYIQRLTTRRI